MLILFSIIFRAEIEVSLLWARLHGLQSRFEISRSVLRGTLPFYFAASLLASVFAPGFVVIISSFLSVQCFVDVIDCRWILSKRTSTLQKGQKGEMPRCIVDT